MGEQSIGVEIERGVARVTIARPEVHNAFDADTIARMAQVFEGLASDGAVRAIVLTGAGKSFSAGADLRWMQETATYTDEDNRADALRLARMLQVVDRVPKPVIARVQGAALGGGLGLVCACDVAIASSAALFGLSEVRLGLIPAVISPYVVRRLGEARARALMLTGERFGAERALAVGLVDAVCAPEALDAAVEAQVAHILKGGPEAHAAVKRLVRAVAGEAPEDVAERTAQMIAEARAGAEGREGVQAFLDKRTPTWRAN